MLSVSIESARLLPDASLAALKVPAVLPDALTQ